MEVYGCTCLEDYPLGNLKCNTLREIIESELYLKLSECKLLEDSPCNSCRYVVLCNGGCPGMSKKFFGDIGMGDIRCDKVKTYYEQKIK